MIQRVVKMIFAPDKLETFYPIFAEAKPKIESQNGCHGVRLLQDIRYPSVLFTYSQWESEEALEAYRKSELFLNTWKKTKKLFAAKAEAWSLLNVEY